MIYFDRQMQRIQEAFEQLDTQVHYFGLSDQKISDGYTSLDLTHFKLHEMEVKYITVDNVLKEKMRKMELYNKIYE